MNDCPNAEIRDQLPDLVHERLEASARAIVVAHIATCVDCRDELQLLREMRGMLERRAPRVDVAYVVGALPKAPAPVAVRVVPRRRVWADWRVAAAVTVLVAGGSSAALLARGAAPASAVVATPALVPSAGSASVASAVTAGAAAASTAPSAASTSAPSSAQLAETTPDNAVSDHPADAVGGGSRLSDLNEDQLQALLKDINNLKPVPVTDPEPVTLRVNSQASSTATEGEGA